MHSNVTHRIFASALALLFLAVAGVAAQGERPASPSGMTSTQIGDKWIDVTYGRPILRGRQGIFGTGADYGKKLYAGGPVWRAGANVTTRIKTELDLEIGGKKVPAGEYSLFIELKEGAWTGILSSQPYMEAFDRAMVGEGITWGAYGYDPKSDVVRAPMAVQTAEVSIDQLIIAFSNVTAEGGNIGVAWDNQIGVLPFKVAK